MKPDTNNIDDIMKRYLPSAPEERVESGTARVLHDLRARPRRVIEAAERPARSLPWKRIAMIPAAVAVVLAVLAGLAWRQEALAIGESEDGSFYKVVDGKLAQLQTGEKIIAGDTVRSDGGGTIKLIDGTRVEVKSQSELSFAEGKSALQINLAHGGVIVNSVAQPVIQTKDIRVPVAGTVLVNAERVGSRVAVIKGEARIVQGTVEKRLKPGEQVATDPSMELLPVSSEIAWSPRSETLLALLRQNAAAGPEPRETFDVISIRRLPESAGGTGARGLAGENAGGGGRCTGKIQLDPSRFAATNISIYFLIGVAYGLGDGRPGCMNVERTGILTGGPEWIKSTNFDIEARIPPGTPALIDREGWRNNRGASAPTLTKDPGPGLRNMLRSMLEDRFSLKLQRETVETSVYILSVGREGPRNLEPWKEGQWVGGASGFGTYEGVVNFLPPRLNYGDAYVAYISGGRMSMDDFVGRLPLFLKKPILNRTGIPGYFNFEVFFAPPDLNALADAQVRAAEQGYTGFRGKVQLASPSLSKALEDQLGLKLEPGRAPVEIFTIQNVDMPSDN